MSQLKVYRARTNRVRVSLGYDVSQDDIRSQIRTGLLPSAPLIVEWDVAFMTDGKNGELVFTLDDSVTVGIQANYGYMDILRTSAGEPLQVCDPFEVVFVDGVTG